MYDKHLLGLEIALIKDQIPAGSKVPDAGCGEAEGTEVYARIPGTKVHAVDLSETRLAKARSRLAHLKNVELKQVDFLSGYDLDFDYDCIVSQRFLINLMEWELQEKVIRDLFRRVKPGGKLLLLEGNLTGVNELNHVRHLMNLSPIPVKWHNRFFDDQQRKGLINELGGFLTAEKGLGTYFVMTRAI